VAEYLDALESDIPLYSEQQLVPPMALAARTLGLLIEKLGLAPGTVHTSQEVTALKPVPIGRQITAEAKPSRPLRRGQWEFLSVAFTLREHRNGETGESVLKGKTTVMSPVEA
jgi:acyl dehydratase